MLSLFSREDQSESAVLTDPTVYAVETAQRVYYGRIVFQDDKQLKLQTADQKAIKILKENIKRIHVVRIDSEKETHGKWKQP